MNKFTEEHFWMRRVMREEGGSFVRSLAECLEAADMPNYAKLENAFPEYIEKYVALGKSLAKTKDETV